MATPVSALAAMAGPVSSKGGDLYVRRVRRRRGKKKAEVIDEEYHVDAKAPVYLAAGALLAALAAGVGVMAWEGVTVKGLGGEWVLVPGVKHQAWVTRIRERPRKIKQPRPVQGGDN